MAQVDGLVILDTDLKGSALAIKDEVDGGPPSKRLKQARLPFKPLEQKPQIVSPQGPKKRKLSGGESPSAKLHKNHKQERQPSGDSQAVSHCTVDHESEVSSSSEAENIPVGLQSRIRNTLDRFVYKGPQEEISSTNECIDITGEDDTSENVENEKQINKESTENNTVKDVLCVVPSEGEKDTVSKSEDSVVTTSDVQVSAAENSENNFVSSGQEDDVKDKVAELDKPLATRDVKEDYASVTSSKDELSHTPAKASHTAPEESTYLTPVSQSPGDSCSDGTPKSGKKTSRSKLSSAKIKEKAALRQKIKEQKEEEKRRKKEQERLEKERIKEEKRKEKEDAKAEKERQREEEKEKKEKERQEKLLLKEEEKKKKQELLEAKLEEKRKKEEEIKQKKEEKLKEEEEKIKKASKVKEAFQSFFINKQRTSPGSKAKEGNSIFMPFEVKKDMKLAPTFRRKQLDDETSAALDKMISEQNTDDSYLKELSTGKRRPRKYIRSQDSKMLEDDVLLAHDSEVVKKVTYHCKLLQFHMNYRPPYYGTWRKSSKIISAKNPWKQDKELFDYEVDSDDEWEEEEPGESLSASEGEDEKEEEAMEGEEEDGWMVPHGYLSEDEGCEADEEVTPELLKQRQLAKVESWENELKRQTQPAIPIIIGCVLEQAVHTLQKQLQETLTSYKAVCLTAEPIPTSHSGVESAKLDSSPSDKNSAATPKNSNRKPVPEEAMPDLIRLVHGNLVGIKKLIKEFRVYWREKVSNETTSVKSSETKMDIDDSKASDVPVSDDKPVAMDTSEASDYNDLHSISKRQLELKISAIAVREKRQAYKKVCWYVHDKVLEQYSLTDLPVPSQWEFVSQPTPCKPKFEESAAPVSTNIKTSKVSITQFARPMSPSEIAAQHAAVAAKQAAEASARLAALEAASKQAAQEALAKKVALDEAIKQAAMVSNLQHNSLESGVPVAGQGILAAFRSPQQKSHLSTSPAALQRKVQSLNGSPNPLPSQAVSSIGQNKRVLPTMLSPEGKLETSTSTSVPKRVTLTMLSPGSQQRRIIPTMISPNNQIKKSVASNVSPGNQKQKVVSPSTVPKRIVPVMLSPLQPVTSKTLNTDQSDKMVKAVNANYNVKPINKMATSPQNSGLKQGNEVKVSPCTGGSSTEDAILID